jgi:hypothetical protein
MLPATILISGTLFWMSPAFSHAEAVGRLAAIS